MNYRVEVQFKNQEEDEVSIYEEVTQIVAEDDFFVLFLKKNDVFKYVLDKAHINKREINFINIFEINVNGSENLE